MRDIFAPEFDTRLALQAFGDQRRARLREAPTDLLLAWHWLTTASAEGAGFDAFFSSLRTAPRPSDAEAGAAIEGRLAGHACRTHDLKVVTEAAGAGWALAYALAWLSVSGGNSVMPPRVRFGDAGLVLVSAEQLRSGSFRRVLDQREVGARVRESGGGSWNTRNRRRAGSGTSTSISTPTSG